MCHPRTHKPVPSVCCQLLHIPVYINGFFTVRMCAVGSVCFVFGSITLQSEYLRGNYIACINIYVFHMHCAVYLHEIGEYPLNMRFTCILLFSQVSFLKC